jgi:hypothetical protein
MTLNRNQVKSVNMSFEKAFINQFLRIILSPPYWEFSPMKLGETTFHIGTGADIRLKMNIFANFLIGE